MSKEFCVLYRGARLWTYNGNEYFTDDLSHPPHIFCNSDGEPFVKKHKSLEKAIEYVYDFRKKEENEHNS